jgi:hypothetical protein
MDQYLEHLHTRTDKRDSNRDINRDINGSPLKAKDRSPGRQVKGTAAHGDLDVKPKRGSSSRSSERSTQTNAPTSTSARAAAATSQQRPQGRQEPFQSLPQQVADSQLWEVRDNMEYASVYLKPTLNAIRIAIDTDPEWQGQDHRANWIWLDMNLKRAMSLSSSLSSLSLQDCSQLAAFQRWESIFKRFEEAARAIIRDYQKFT